MKRARFSGIWLLLGASVWPACRAVSVCESSADCARSTSMAGEGGESALPAQGGGAPGGVSGAGGRDGGGDGGDEDGGAATNGAAGLAGVSGEAAGGAPPAGPSCAPGTDDCDDSTFTVCETPTSFSFRHCGACNARCDGTCSVGKCKPAENLLDKGVESSAANASALFALVSAPDDRENLHRFDAKTGADSVLAEGLQAGADLLLGSERLYAFDPFSKQVLSLGLDGSGAITEAFSPVTFGVSNAGIYYTSYVNDTLWFRPRDASAFTALSVGKACSILGSSSQAVLVYRETDGSPEVLLAHGAELTRLGDSPGDAQAQAPAADGAVFLLSGDTGYKLVWLRPDKPLTEFTVEGELEESKLVPAPGGVALQLEDHHNTFVRLYSPEGRDTPPLGIPSTSMLAFVDERYLWYSWYGAPDASQHFQRARQFELNDVVPLDRK
jgi:hypothetical protein